MEVDEYNSKVGDSIEDCVSRLSYATISEKCATHFLGYNEKNPFTFLIEQR